MGQVAEVQRDAGQGVVGLDSLLRNGAGSQPDGAGQVRQEDALGEDVPALGRGEKRAVREPLDCKK